MKALCEKPRLRRLLDHFSAVADPREQWRVAYPLAGGAALGGVRHDRVLR